MSLYRETQSLLYFTTTEKPGETPAWGVAPGFFHPESGKEQILYLVAVASQEVELHGGQDADNDDDGDRADVAASAED